MLHTGYIFFNHTQFYGTGSSFSIVAEEVIGYHNHQYGQVLFHHIPRKNYQDLFIACLYVVHIQILGESLS